MATIVEREFANFVGGTNCCDVFFASIFLAYVEPKLFFRTRGGKILQYSPYLSQILVGCCVPPSTGSHQNSRPRRSLYFYFFIALFDPRKQRVNVLPHTFHPVASPLQLPPHRRHSFFGLTLLNYFRRRHCIC